MMGSIYDVAYVAVPLLLTTAIVDGATLGVWRGVRIAVLGAGVVAVGRTPGRRRDHGSFRLQSYS